MSLSLSGILALIILLLSVVMLILVVIVIQISGSFKKIDFSKFKKEEEENEYEEEIMNIAHEGHEQGAILADEAEMISNIFEFGDKDAKDVMQFRRKIVGMESGMSLDEAIRFMVGQRYSRYPVFKDDLDHIIGILHFRDAVKAYLENPDRTIDDVLRKPYYVHEAMNINELLTHMQTDKVHLAIVLDEFGQTVGLVAMEDILETIVGNIMDEYDVEEHDIVKLPGQNKFLARGMIRLDDLEEVLGITFDTEEFETLNGFLINEIGHLPEFGEKVRVEFKGYVFEATQPKDKVLRSIYIKRTEGETEDTGEAKDVDDDSKK